MTDRAAYQILKKIAQHNQTEAKKRIEARFGGTPPNCENKAGKPICPVYDLCKQVKTYEVGKIREPLCALPDDEVKQFAKSSRKFRKGPEIDDRKYPTPE